MILCWCAQYLCLQYTGYGHFLQHRIVSIFGFLPPLKLSTLQTASKENSWSGTCKCGMKKTTRIVGGSETEVSQAKHDCAKEISFFGHNFSTLKHYVVVDGRWMSIHGSPPSTSVEWTDRILEDALLPWSVFSSSHPVKNLASATGYWLKYGFLMPVCVLWPISQ